MKWNRLAGIAACAAVIGSASPGSALANILVNTDFGFGELELFYGVTGAAGLKGFYVLASGTSPANDVESASGLDFTEPVPISGAGTSDLLVEYRLANTTGAPTSPMKFIALVNPDGSFLDPFDFATVNMVAGPGEPSRFGIDDFDPLGGINVDITAGQLSNANNCGVGVSCDVQFALQWEIPALQPNEIALVRVALSDSQSSPPLSGSFLTATQTDSTGVILEPVENFLKFSGTVQVVPEPGTYAMLLAGIGLLALLRLRRS